jgi:prevent-host-death family protein
MAFGRFLGIVELVMATFTVRAAKANLSRLIRRADAGEEIIIARGKRPVARLVAIGVPKHVLRRRAFGAFKGKFDFPDSFFFDPLPEEDL